MNQSARSIVRLVVMCAILLTPFASNLEAATAQGSGAILQIVMRGCPEGFNPNGGNFHVECTIPLDAPDVSVIGSNQNFVPITSLERRWDGGYVFYANSGALSVHVSGLAPVLRDGYQVWNYDRQEGDTYSFDLVAGETREAHVFYYYNLNGAPVTSNSGTEATTVEIASASVIGTPMMGVCYELIELGRSACLEPGSDVVVFTDIPPGTYIAHQTEDLGNNYVTDFTFEVLGDTPLQRVGTTVVTPWGSPSRIGQFNDVGVVDYDYANWPGGTDNISIVFMDASTGKIALTNGCVQIVEVTSNGCDTFTGQIDFLDVPVGPHEIEVTAIPDGYELAPGMDQLPLHNPGGTPNGPMRVVYFIDVQPLTAATPSAEVPATDASAISGTSLVRIETSIVGWPFTSACYELIEIAKENCSVMAGDMQYQAIFQNVPFGTYTVRQTADLGDEIPLYVPDFSIEVTEAEQAFHTQVVISYGSPSRSGVASPSDLGIEFVSDFQELETFAVYVVFIDVETGEKVTSDACAQILGATNVACDMQRGQIDFTYVPSGRYELNLTSLPAGYELAPGMEDLPIAIPARGSMAEPSHLVYYVDVRPAAGD